MAQTYRDPVTYLNEAVTRRGKSGPDGVYLHNVTVVAEASSDFSLNLSYGTPVSPVVPPLGASYEEWYELLVNLRWNLRSLSHRLNLDEGAGLIFQFLSEGNSLSMNVFAPEVGTSDFPYILQIAKDTLICASDFTSKVAGTIRFSIGVATKSWGDMVEEGDVEERDLNF